MQRSSYHTYARYTEEQYMVWIVRRAVWKGRFLVFAPPPGLVCTLSLVGGVTNNGSPATGAELTAFQHVWLGKR